MHKPHFSSLSLVVVASGRRSPCRSRARRMCPRGIVPNEIHNMARYASWMQFFSATDRYFAEHLEKRATAKPQ